MPEPTSNFVSNGRLYIHSKCDTETCVSGEHFLAICNPFCPGKKTHCMGCRGFVPLRDVYWKDTDESIADYRRRMFSKAPIFWRLWGRGLNLVIGAVVGGLGGAFLVGNEYRAFKMVLGAVFVAEGLRTTVTGGMIAAMIGIKFHRQQ